MKRDAGVRRALMKLIKRNKNKEKKQNRNRFRLKKKQITFNPAEIKASFKTARTKNGAYSVTMIAIVIVLAVLVNLFCSKLPATVQQIDISNNKIYEISDTTKEMLDELEYDITITVLAETDSIDERLTTFLEKYVVLF